MRPAWVLDHAPYTPFMEPRTAHPPGLSPLDPGAWILTDLDHEAQMAERRRLMREVPELVFGLLPEGAAPVEELRDRVFAFLGQTIPGEGDPLTQLGHAAADDFCLLLPDRDAGEYRLVAAVLCFPSRWRLSDKLGRSLTPIHAPVPGYAAELSRRVNRVFESLRAERPLYRINWLVHDTPELHLPMDLSEKFAPGGETMGSFYLRTERQTLMRLPMTGAVVFGIKTTITALDTLPADQAAAIARELRQLTPAMVAYRAGAKATEAALSLLDRLTAGQGKSAHAAKL